MITGPRPGHSVRGGGRWVEGWTPECARESFSQGPILVTGLDGLNTTGHASPAHPPTSAARANWVKGHCKALQQCLGRRGEGIMGKLVCFCPGK